MVATRSRSSWQHRRSSRLGCRVIGARRDLLVVSAASGFVLALAAIAEWRDAPILDATVSATGHLSHRDDGRFGFTVIEINAELETIPGGEAKVEAAAKAAEQRCLIANALDVPVQVAVSVKTRSEAAALVAS